MTPSVCRFRGAVLFALIGFLAGCCSSPEGKTSTSGASAGSTGGGGTTTSSAGSTSGSGITSGTTSGPTTGGAPITAPASTWTWVDFPTASCANGQPTGIGVNLSPNGSKVLIYLEGGGACWSQLTCYTLMTASYVTTGYTETDFQTESTDQTYLAEPGGFFDRTAAANPFQDYSYVYIPYCTGDLHAGNNVVDYQANTPTLHVGYANIGQYLQRLVPTFASATQVVLAGSGEGGDGALYNWFRVQQAFGAIPVLMVDDSGPFLPADVTSQASTAEQDWITEWGLASTWPSGCTGCAASLDALYGFYAGALQTRGALLSYTQDTVVPSLWSLSQSQFLQGLDEDATADFDPSQSLKYFFVDESGHVLWFDPTVEQNDVSLETFVTQMVTNDGGWVSVHP